MRDLNFERLNNKQIVNHYLKNREITTKVGLSHNLKKLIWEQNIDIDTFFPVTFDLIDEEIKDCIEQFKALKAENVLKEYIYKNKSVEDINFGRLIAAIRVSERRLMEVEDWVDGWNKGDCLATREEWEILSAHKTQLSRLLTGKLDTWYHSILQIYSSYLEPLPLLNYSEPNAIHPDKNKISPLEELIDLTITNNPPANTSISILHQNKTQIITENSEPRDKKLRKRVEDILNLLLKKFPQFKLNGHRNIWIVKPAGMSRGRGITLTHCLSEILEHAKGKHFIVQKYIENPMIILDRKVYIYIYIYNIIVV